MNNYLSGIDYDAYEGVPAYMCPTTTLKDTDILLLITMARQTNLFFFKKLIEHGSHKRQGELDWHHIAEGRRLTPLYKNTTYQMLYKTHWPAVLIHRREEHHILNGLFNDKGTAIMLAKPVATMPLSGNEKERYFNNLYQLYTNYYTGDSILKKIA